VIRHWQKHGVPREEAMFLQQQFEQKWPGIYAGLQGGKARRTGK
jgi:hypothetical protein